MLVHLGLPQWQALFTPFGPTPWARVIINIFEKLMNDGQYIPLEIEIFYTIYFLSLSLSSICHLCQYTNKKLSLSCFSTWSIWSLPIFWVTVTRTMSLMTSLWLLWIRQYSRRGNSRGKTSRRRKIKTICDTQLFKKLWIRSKPLCHMTVCAWIH